MLVETALDNGISFAIIAIIFGGWLPVELAHATEKILNRHMSETQTGFIITLPPFFNERIP
jgi:hypothetical protein